MHELKDMHEHPVLLVPGQVLLHKARKIAERVMHCAPVRQVDPGAAEHRAQWAARHA